MLQKSKSESLPALRAKLEEKTAALEVSEAARAAAEAARAEALARVRGLIRGIEIINSCSGLPVRR
jgi:hypothetical protein